MLQLDTNVTPAIVTLNYEVLKENLALNLKKYENYLVTEDTLTSDKKVRADLNKVKTQIADARKMAKREALRQYEEEVEPKFKELEQMIDRVSSQIDAQVKDFEAREKEGKRLAINEIWNGIGFDKIQLEQIWDDKWLNKTVSLAKVSEAIAIKLNEIATNILVLEKMAKDEETKLALQSKYYLSLDLGKVIAEYEKEQSMKEILIADRTPKVEPQVQPVEEDTEIGTIDSPKQEKIFTVIMQIQGTKNQLVALYDALKQYGLNVTRRKDLEA